MKNEKIGVLLEMLIDYAKNKLSLKDEDVCVVRNRLLFEFKLSEKENSFPPYKNFQEDILNPILSYAISNNLTTEEESLLFETRLIGILMPMPSSIISKFDEIMYYDGIEKALEYFYNISINSNYIRTVDIEKNKNWDFKGPMGDISVTINLSKPEKDPKQIALALKEKKASYPSCMLCVDNVGFYGTMSHPSRVTLRTIPICLADENWHFQYSPYSYFKEHCIALSEEHRIMLVNEKTYTRLFDFVELFPCYFIGSNAALPIVGGSILSHDHYQGGLMLLPIMKANDKKIYESESFKNIKISIVDWYNSVIRLSSKNREELESCINFVVNSWENYSDESVSILAKTTDQHNAVTPVARFVDGLYIMDLILRNNRTDEKHPHGIFHVCEELHNIKKEGIGLIEAMGKFILPGRLAFEAEGIREYLTGKKVLNFKDIADKENPLSKHLGMIMQLVNDFGTSLSDEKAGDVITEFINNACIKILECTAVFKNNTEGELAFVKFLNSMDFISKEIDDYLLNSKSEKDKEIEKLKLENTNKKNIKLEKQKEHNNVNNNNANKQNMNLNNSNKKHINTTIKNEQSIDKNNNGLKQNHHIKNEIKKENKPTVLLQENNKNDADKQIKNKKVKKENE